MKRKRFLQVFLVFLLLMLGSSTLSLNAHQAAAATTQAGYWNLDEGSGTTANDISGQGNNGTLQSGASWAPGVIGSSALSLNGTNTSYVDIPSPVINTAQSFSVAAWVKVNTVSGYQTFVSLDGSQVSAFYLQLRADTGKFALTRLAGDSTTATGAIASAVSAPKPGVWYHLVGVYDSVAKTLALYVNGSLQQTVGYPISWQATGHTEIGRGLFGGNRVDFVGGQIDDVHIFNGALNAKSAADLAAADYWTFDAGSGTTAVDATGNNRSGTLQSGASWAPGIVGPSALSLNGTSTSYVDVPSPVVNTAQSFSVAAWVKVNTVSGYQTFVSLDGSQVSAFYLQLRGDTGKFAFTRLASDSTTATTAVASATSAPTAGTWYHLVGVYDASANTLALYVNGDLQQQVSYTGGWQGSGHTEIGRGLYGGNPVDFVGGQIDDVHAFNVALDSVAATTLAGGSPTTGAALTIQGNQTGAQISPTLYGLMFEDISHSGDGGLYGELIQNRIMKNADTPVDWSVVNSSGAQGSIALDDTQPINSVALTTSLKLDITQVSKGQRVGVANDGYWGIPVLPRTLYRGSFYAMASSDFRGPLTVSIESNSGQTIYAHATVSKVSTTWKQYSFAFTTGNVAPSETNHFVISAGHTGTVWFNLVSLFPPTWNNRANGLRPDLMSLLNNMHPSFLRFPGGNFLEGLTTADYFNWKQTIGPLSQRPGHNDPWGYYSSDGLGLLEYLEWCEDLHISPVLAVYAGYALNGTHIPVGTPQFNALVQDAVDEVQYATGSINTKWGKIRAADGHPKPFSIQYVEVGNEDFFDSSGSYDARFSGFYDALKLNYPSIKLIATTTVTSRTPDVYDEHFYLTPAGMESLATRYDSYDRNAPKIFVGEYASQ